MYSRWGTRSIRAAESSLLVIPRRFFIFLRCYTNEQKCFLMNLFLLLLLHFILIFFDSFKFCEPCEIVKGKLQTFNMYTSLNCCCCCCCRDEVRMLIKLGCIFKNKERDIVILGTFIQPEG